MTLSDWQSKGKYYDVNGHKVFAITAGENKPYLLILHGFPTCSFDYHRVLEALSLTYQVVLHDHLGFGLSDKPQHYSYSLIEQADIAIALWQQMGIQQAHLVAHDYGTSIATEILARRERGWEPIQLQSLSLCNGSMHIEMAKLRPIQKLLLHKRLGPLVSKWSTKRIFLRNMRRIWGDASNIAVEEHEILWEMLLFNDGRSVIHRVAQYIRERHLFWHRWIGALQQTNLPINILWATEDPVAVKEMAVVLSKEIKQNRLEWLENIGHYPMLEAPDKWQRKLLYLLSL